MAGYEYGPLNKTVHTQTLELLVKMILANPGAVSMKIENQGPEPYLSAQVGDFSLNVSYLLKHANFSHIALDTLDSQRFIDHHFCSLVKPSKDPRYASLTSGEKSAIYDYTSVIDFVHINQLLHGKTHIAADLKKTLVKTLMVCSGLNKIAPSSSSQTIYRGESHIRDKDITQRIALVKHRGFSQEPSLKSTSSEARVASGFKGKSFMTIVNHTGKDISGLSQFKYEKEMLLLPEKIEWISHIQQNGRHVFKGQVVNPLDPQRDTVQAQDLARFRRLQELAQKASIDPSFITEHNQKALLFSTHKPKAPKPLCAPLASPYEIAPCPKLVMAY